MTAQAVAISFRAQGIFICLKEPFERSMQRCTRGATPLQNWQFRGNLERHGNLKVSERRRRG